NAPYCSAVEDSSQPSHAEKRIFSRYVSRRANALLLSESVRLEQDGIRLGRDDGPSRAPDASGVSGASRGPFYFAWGCFRDLVSGPCGVPAKSICSASGTRDRWLR